MKATKPRSRHGLTAPMVRVKLQGFRAIDRRTAGGRGALAFRSELIAALGGEADLSPQRRRLVEMAARAALLVDHVDGWLVGQRSLVNTRSRSLLPVLTQRQALADHLVRVLEKLGLDRMPKKVTDLATYLQSQYGESGSDRERTPRTAGEAARHPISTEGAPNTWGFRGFVIILRLARIPFEALRQPDDQPSCSFTATRRHVSSV